MRKLRIFNFSLYTRSRRPSMRKFTLNPACRKAELKDVYLALSKYVRHHTARNGQFRAKHQSRSFSRSSPLSNTSQAGLKSKDTFDAYRRQLASKETRLVLMNSAHITFQERSLTGSTHSLKSLQTKKHYSRRVSRMWKERQHYTGILEQLVQPIRRSNSPTLSMSTSEMPAN